MSAAFNLRRKLYLRAGKERAISNRHPWIFSGAIGREEGPENAPIGDLYDSKGKQVASGFYSASSQIRLRALTFGEETCSEELLARRIAGAIDRRDAIAGDSLTALRLINSEGDELSGITVDRYGDLLVAEITSAGAEGVRDVIVESLKKRFGDAAILFHNAVGSRKLENLPLENESMGEIPPEVIIRENGMQFVVTPREGQKTGFFLDQRDNRLLARQLAAGKRVLNLFSYSGGFGVNAAAGGASSVEEVDISEPAIELARRNHQLNSSPLDVQFTMADAFDYTRKISPQARGSFELVICDPPAFAKSRGEVERAARGYKDINMQAMKLVAPGGWLMTFSCSSHISLDLFQKVVFAAAFDSRCPMSMVRRLGAGEDHPVSLFCPEGEYLKGFLLRNVG